MTTRRGAVSPNKQCQARQALSLFVIRMSDSEDEEFVDAEDDDMPELTRASRSAKKCFSSSHRLALNM